MLFFDMNNLNVQFGAKSFAWKSYIVGNALSIIRQVKLIDKRKFTKAALDKNFETFILHVAAPRTTTTVEMKIHYVQAAQVAKDDQVQIPAL